MSQPFYERAGGLRFECTRCGACCTRPGPVYFPPEDLARAARRLGLTPAAFRRRFRVRPLHGVDAIDPPDGEACVFHRDGEGCAIYDARPTQCRTWPFWPETVKRERSWRRAARGCEGIGRGGIHAPEQVRAELDLIDDVGLPEGEPW